jgi:putative aldouronate transport system substrate-binding protein
LFKRDPNSIYMAVDGPANSRMDPPRLPGQGISGWTLTYISKKNHNPARAIRFMTYWLSEEGQQDFFLGRKGETWDVIDGVSQFKPEVQKLFQENREEFAKTYAGGDTFWMLMDWPYVEQFRPEAVTPLKELSEWSKPYTISHSQYGRMIAPGDEDEGIISAKLTELRGRSLTALMTAPNEAEFNRIWNDWHAQEKVLGVDKLLDWMTDRLIENKAKLNMED